MRATGILIAALIVGVWAVGCKPETATKTAAPPPLVYVADAIHRDIKIGASVIGEVQAENRVELTARVKGFLLERNFKEGAIVKKGEVLFRIEPYEYAANLDRAKADIAKAEADLLKNNLDFERQKELVSKNAVAKREYDSAVAAKKNSEADVAAAQARLKTAELDLSYTVIEAPFDGMIGYSAYSVGSLVGPESGTLATVVSLDPIYVDFNVNELKLLEMLNLKAEQIPELVVSFRFQNQQEYSETGKLAAMNNEISASTGTMKMRAVFANPKLVLRPGMYGRVTVTTEAGIPAVLVPRVALSSDIEGDYLYVVGADDKVERRNVKLGQDDGAYVMVLSGVSSGERVITSGIQKSRIGMPVKAENDPNFTENAV